MRHCAPVLVNADRWVSFACKFFISAVYGLMFVYASELFPTSVRTIGASAAQIGDQCGIILGPYVVFSNQLWLPYIVFGGFSLLAIILTVTVLVETFNRHIPETLVQMRHMVINTVQKTAQTLSE